MIDEKIVFKIQFEVLHHPYNFQVQYSISPVKIKNRKDIKNHQRNRYYYYGVGDNNLTIQT